MRLTKYFLLFLATAFLSNLLVGCSDDDNVYTKVGGLNFSTKYLKDYSEEDGKEPPTTNVDGAFDIDFSLEREGVVGFNKNEIINDFKINASSFSFEFSKKKIVDGEEVAVDNPNADKVKKISLDLTLGEMAEHYDILVENTASIDLNNETYKNLAYSLFQKLFKEGSGTLKVKSVMLDAEGKPVEGVKFHINLKADLDLYVVWNDNIKG